MMTPNEYAELFNYVNENHSWQNMYENVNEGRKIVKYVTCSCDTRDGSIWIVNIQFHQISNSPLPNDKKYDNISFSEEKCTKENIMEWLNNYKKEEVKDIDQI